MTPNESQPQPTTDTPTITKPAKKINGNFVKDHGANLTPEQMRAMARFYRDCKTVERQWAKITGIQLPEW